MTDEQIKNSFIQSARNWVCDKYSASIRFIAGVDNDDYTIWDSTVLLTPLPPENDNSFFIQGEKIYVGQLNLNSASQQELSQLTKNAQKGIIETPDGILKLPHTGKYSYYTDAIQRDLWFYQLHLQVTGNQDQLTSQSELSSIDNFLRLSTPPFDGLNDVANWLGLKISGNYNKNPAINVSVSPPVDLIIDECSLENNTFKVVLHAHPQFNVELISLAVKVIPGNNLKTRTQIAKKIIWQDAQNNKRIGTATIIIENCDNVLAMLLISDTVVRKQWFMDPTKARNNRLIAIQSFDKELKMIRGSILETTDSHKFEYGVAALLFLLGFSPCVQLETNSPDIIVQTPGGRIILIECTLRISDFSSKLGKLVDRRGALNKELEQSGHASKIAIALVCRLPRDQIAVDQNELSNQNALLISHETLLEAFNLLRNHNDPDKILQDAEATLTANNAEGTEEIKS